MEGDSLLEDVEMEVGEARDSSLSPPPLTINYVRIMLLDDGGQNVLMELTDGGIWDLPYMVLPWGLTTHVSPCCYKLQEQLGYESEDQLFTVIAELLGEVGCMHARGKKDETKLGYAKLLFVEPEPHAELHGMKDLPARFAWKGLSFVSSIKYEEGYDESAKIPYNAVKAVLQGSDSLEELFPHPPFQTGWFQKSSAWLVEEVKRLGHSTTSHPIQYRVSHSSSIILADSTYGGIFLKGVVAGSCELQITSAVSKLFPACTADLLSVNKQLQAFITREFEDYTKAEGKMAILQALGHVQKESVAHADDLIAAGVPSLRLEDVEETIKRWCNDEVLMEVAARWMRDFESILPGVVKMVEKLKQYNLPMCLVHGDVSMRNTAIKELDDGSKHLILHDWQFAVVGHPFFDLHDFREDWEDALDVYLGLWEEYEPLERAREAYEIGKALGWLVKIMGTLECMRQGDVRKQFGVSTMLDFFEDVLGILRGQVEFFLGTEEGYGA